MSASPANAADEPVAMTRYRALAPHLDGEATLKAAAAEAEVPYRTMQRWLADYRRGGLSALSRPQRPDKGQRKLPGDLVALVEGLALTKPKPSVTVIHRKAVSVAAAQGWPAPGYKTVYRIVRALDPALVVLAHQGAKRYRERYELVYRREAKAPNEIWQADHTELDLWVLDAAGRPARPWLTVIEDDHSRAAAGYAVNLEAPSALTTALAFRHAIWRKSEADWHVCGIPDTFHLDNGSDFTSSHLEQVMADLHVTPIFTLPGQPHGHGKIERLIGTFNLMCLPHLPGYAPAGTPNREEQAALTLPQLDAQVNRFIREVYNRRPHAATGKPPQERWEDGAFIPRMPDSLEQLDLLLLTVAKPRKIHTDGIHFLDLRFIDPVLADYVGEQTTIRYDPRDITEIRVYLRTFDGEVFLCRAICPELSEQTVSLKEITAARNARRRDLRGTLTARKDVVARLLAAHGEPLPAAYPARSPGAPRNFATPDGPTLSPATPAPDPRPAPEQAPRLKRYRNE